MLTRSTLRPTPLPVSAQGRSSALTWFTLGAAAVVVMRVSLRCRQRSRQGGSGGRLERLGARRQDSAGVGPVDAVLPWLRQHDVISGPCRLRSPTHPKPVEQRVAFLDELGR